ncbi:MAG TPA: hypothetical protein VFC46_09900 [Humisphaera sp.]|nr:hypothetical protein [Humisphaera sp.]
MISTHELLRRPSEILSHAQEMWRPRHKSHTAGIGGVVMLVIAVGVFVWLFPELRRYVRMSRM